LIPTQIGWFTNKPVLTESADKLKTRNSHIVYEVHKPDPIANPSGKPMTNTNSGYSSQDMNDEYYDQRIRNLMAEEKAKIKKMKFDEQKKKQCKLQITFI
jgi:hypothetical protein